MSDKPRDGQPGTTDQKPRWTGAEDTRPRGYLAAENDAEHETDADGEDINDRSNLSEVLPEKDPQARYGAGPALAAHSKDASSTGATGQNSAAAAKRPPAQE